MDRVRLTNELTAVLAYTGSILCPLPLTRLLRYMHVCIFQTVWFLIYGFEIIEKNMTEEEHDMNENTILSLYTKGEEETQ